MTASVPMTYYLFPVITGPIDLSKATKLEDIVFRLSTLVVEWIVMAFQATIPEHRELRQVTIHFPRMDIDFDNIKGSSVYRQWMDLDRLLVRFWESCLTPPKVICTALVGETCIMRGFVECCLPELTKRGMIDLVG